MKCPRCKSMHITEDFMCKEGISMRCNECGYDWVKNND